MARDQATPAYGSYHDLIDILAANAKHLGWGAGDTMSERVRRAFDQYGFGRGKEVEPNSGPQLNANDGHMQRNLMASGKRHRRAISGEVCGTDEDAFPINERVAVGDLVSIELSNRDSFELRVWQTQPCPFDDKTCTKQFQVFPKPADDGSSVDTGAISFSFPPGSGGASPSGSKWRSVYLGVRRKSGPCTQSYTVYVEVVRAVGNEVYP